MVLLRYLLYFFGVALFTWLLTYLEIVSPGGLRLQTFTYVDDVLGTSEYSPIEMLQPGILTICGLLYAWVAQHCPQQRPIALTFGGIAVMFFIRELDFFLDRYIVDNFWQAPAAVIAALIIVYNWRNARRFRVAWLRIVKLAVEELIELMGYFFWLIGTAEFWFQARAIAIREPQPAAVRRRDGRKRDGEGRY